MSRDAEFGLLRGLGKEAITTIPLYAFYNPAHVCAASGGTVSGVKLASGWEIRERIKAIVKLKPKRLWVAGCHEGSC